MLVRSDRLFEHAICWCAVFFGRPGCGPVYPRGRPVVVPLHVHAESAAAVVQRTPHFHAAVARFIVSQNMARKVNSHLNLTVLECSS